MNRVSSLLLALPFFLISCSCSLLRHEKIDAEVTVPAPVHEHVLGSVKEILTFDEIKTADKAVVKFFASWCGACTASEGAYQKLAGEYASIPFFVVDVDKAGAFAQQFSVGSIPTIIIFEKGVAKESIVGFDADRIKSVLGQAVKVVDQEPRAQAIDKILIITDIDQFIPEVLQNQPMPVIVKFYSSGCGFCKAIAPTYKEFAQKYNPSLKFVEIEMTDHYDLARKYSIKGYPTFIIFKNGEKHVMFSGANKLRLEQEIKKVAGLS